MANEKNVSKAVISRLPRYYRTLRELAERGIRRISSKELAKQMDLTASQIRQDLSCFGGFGQQGYGYSVDKLIVELERILGVAGSQRAILLGVGNLGRALLRNFDFSYCGVRPIAAFDIAPSVIGSDFRGIQVHALHELEAFCERERPDIAVLCVPADQAQSEAERLVRAGIRGIWNFSNVSLKEDALGVPVQDVHFSDSLMTLCYRMKDTDPFEFGE
ncbi:MAG: redox-sensing transcriptional repressor Rex [Eubacteriales bacterium]|nr:redox-sensing transcriptional repressor Rex [Eubacteriales bacterium]